MKTKGSVGCATQHWKTNRRTAAAFHSELKEAGKSCPLWSVPGVSSQLVMVDWLHCCDLGVAADVMGNVLLEIVNAMDDKESQDSRMKNSVARNCSKLQKDEC